MGQSRLLPSWGPGHRGKVEEGESRGQRREEEKGRENCGEKKRKER